MFRSILLLSLASLVLGAPKSLLSRRFQNVMNGRIVGGEDANIADYPYQASLERNGAHICGAVIVSESWILTAAHCTYGSSASSLSVRVGTSNVQSGGSTARVSAIHQNPDYDSWTIDYDISLLKLSSSLSLGNGVQAVGLPSESESLSAGSNVVVTGWGTTSENSNQLASRLQVVTVSVVAPTECQARYASEHITDRMLCAGAIGGGKDACSGDSGGPLVANGKVWGLTSWGYGCARPEYPGVYTNVPNLRGYIRQVSGL